MKYQPKDRYFHKAKSEGFAARSVYKLEEMDQRFKLFKAGQVVLDLGCFPGSWTQYTARRVGLKGHVLGVDLKKVDLKLPQATFLVENAFEADPKLWPYSEFDVIISDMAPATTGIRSVDQARSEDLCHRVLELAKQSLKFHGHLVMKLFEGQGGELFVKDLKPLFQKVERFKPKAVRPGSIETYIIGLRSLR